MNRNAERSETVFVSANLSGQMIITPAVAHERLLRQLGLDADHGATAAQGSEELDSKGRLSLPVEIAAFLRPKSPGVPRQ